MTWQVIVLPPFATTGGLARRVEQPVRSTCRSQRETPLCCHALGRKARRMPMVTLVVRLRGRGTSSGLGLVPTRPLLG